MYLRLVEVSSGRVVAIASTVTDLEVARYARVTDGYRLPFDRAEAERRFRIEGPQ